MRPQNPCKDCADRTAECHAICERFKEFEKAQVAYREEVHKNRTDNLSPRRRWTPLEIRRKGSR